MKLGWEIKKLGEVCIISAGQGAPQGESNYCTNGIPFIKAGNLEDLINGFPESDIQNVSEDVAEKHRLKLYKTGSVVFAKSGMSCMKGYVYVLKNDCYVVSHLAILTPHSISTFFLKYLLDFYRPNTLVKDEAYPSISLEDIKSFSIPVPPRAEQERIVAELDCLSGVIEKKKQQLKEFDALAQSIFYQMFGDPITNEKGWEVKKLSDAVSIDCPISYGIVQPMDDVEGGIPIVRPIDLVDTFVRKDNLKRTSVDISNAYKRTILRGDEILMCVRGTTGVVSMASDELKGCNTTRGIVPLFFDSINRWFVYYLIKQPSMQCLIAENTYGIALKQINIKELRLLPIITPPLSFQQEFADKIEAIEKQKELIKQSITETEELFNSRMDYYFN